MEQLKRAEKSILISTYSIYNTGKTKQITDLLIAKANEGVTIKIIVPEVKSKTNSGMRKALRQLKHNLSLLYDIMTTWL